MTAPPALRLATRGSRLARAQTAAVASALLETGVATETVVIRTRGDERAFQADESVAGEGWFTTELERSLMDGRCDAAVHSAKDLPTRSAEGLCISALVERADPADAAVTRDGRALNRLAAGSVVGTGSPRRQALLSALFPALAFAPIWGNVDTRLASLDAGAVDAVVLAGAGLVRLGLERRIAERLDPRVFVPAPAQGAIAVQTVIGSEAAGRCSRLNHAATVAAVQAERSVLSFLGGGCLLPLGAWARVESGLLVITGAFAGAAGFQTVELSGSPSDPTALGAAIAERLR